VPGLEASSCTPQVYRRARQRQLRHVQSPTQPGDGCFTSSSRSNASTGAGVVQRLQQRGRRGSNPQPSDRQSETAKSQVAANKGLAPIGHANLTTNPTTAAGSREQHNGDAPLADLAEVVASWPALPEAVRSEILLLVRAS